MKTYTIMGYYPKREAEVCGTAQGISKENAFQHWRSLWGCDDARAKEEGVTRLDGWRKYLTYEAIEAAE